MFSIQSRLGGLSILLFCGMIGSATADISAVIKASPHARIVKVAKVINVLKKYDISISDVRLTVNDELDNDMEVAIKADVDTPVGTLTSLIKSLQDVGVEQFSMNASASSSEPLSPKSSPADARASKKHAVANPVAGSTQRCRNSQRCCNSRPSILQQIARRVSQRFDRVLGAGRHCRAR